jgi:hypothetical protein
LNVPEVWQVSDGLGKFVIINPRHYDMDIYPVEQGTGNAFLVLGDDARGTGARFDRVSKVAAGAGVWSIITVLIGGMIVGHCSLLEHKDHERIFRKEFRIALSYCTTCK